MSDAIEAAEETVEDIIDDVESIFSPKPGGMVHRHREERARREAAQKEAEQAAERIEEPAYKGVKTTQLMPQITVTNTFNIAPGAYQQILPLSNYRYRASVILSTAASTVNLAESLTKAVGGIGYPLPSGVPFTVQSRAQLYGYNPGGATITVSVLVELYAPEK